ncbi:MAG: alcohol dehydrogenase catalytic domain-containing protein, partial [Solobacterium sp.]|nr:alcohol dehydrogenase catalytic domain-containing protein [Solobacterium sp.]
MATMKQQVMLKPARGTEVPAEIIFRDIEIPEPGPGEVLIKMKRIGVCGSDIHVYYGEQSGTGYPVTQGHEVSGQIVKLGPDTGEFHVGQKVTVEPQVV